jgi:hypothetical protein
LFRVSQRGTTVTGARPCSPRVLGRSRSARIASLGDTRKGTIGGWSGPMALGQRGA